MDIYKNIKTEGNYKKLLNSGMFWEMHPELTGEWKKDKEVINKSKTIQDVKVGDPIISKTGRKGKVISRTKRTITIKFEFSTCKLSYNKNNAEFIESDIL